MLNRPIKRLASQTTRALGSRPALKAPVVTLGDEDLLDFADIFATVDPTPRHDMAEAEMSRSELSL